MGSLITSPVMKTMRRHRSGSLCAQALVNLPAVQSGHFPIAEGHVKTVLFQFAQAGFPMGDHLHFISVMPQFFADQIQNGLFIINDQHAPAGPFARVYFFRLWRSLTPSAGIPGGLHRRQFDGKRRPFPVPARRG